MGELRIDVEPEETLDCVGLHLGRAEGIPVDVARRGWKQAIMDHFKKTGQKAVPGAPFLSIVLPCGERVEYQTFGDIPEDDVPCACGNPRHWFVRHYLNVPVSKN